MYEPIVVEVSGKSSKVYTIPTGSATRLTQLVDVDIAGVQDGYVLSYDSSLGKFVAVPIDGGTF